MLSLLANESTADLTPATVVSKRTTRLADAPAANAAGTLVTIVKPLPVSVAALMINGAAPVFFTVKVLITAELPNGAVPNATVLPLATATVPLKTSTSGTVTVPIRVKL